MGLAIMSTNSGLYMREWRSKNRGKFHKIQKRYRDKHPEQIRKARRRYALRYPDKEKERKRRWRQSHAEFLKEYFRRYRRSNLRNPKYRYNKYKSNARVRGFEMLLPFGVFESLLLMPCHYCGSTEWIGIDRKDSDIGYSIENSVSCCWPCNKFKGSKDYGSLYELCERIKLNCNNH